MEMRARVTHPTGEGPVSRFVPRYQNAEIIVYAHERDAYKFWKETRWDALNMGPTGDQDRQKGGH